MLICYAELIPATRLCRGGIAWTENETPALVRCLGHFCLGRRAGAWVCKIYKRHQNGIDIQKADRTLMKRISFWAIGIGLAFIVFATLMPSIIRAQATETLARYGATDSIETLVQITLEDLRVTLILMAVAGMALVISGALILRRNRIGWKLLLAYFALELIARAIQIVLLQGSLPIVIGGMVYGILLWRALKLQTRDEFIGWWRNNDAMPNA